MKPLIAWALGVSVVIFCLLEWGCQRERPVQVGVSTARSA